MFWILIVLGIVLIILIFFIYYLKLLKLNQQVDNSLIQINIQLKKRTQLIPDLLANIKGYVKNKNKIISDANKAREQLSGSQNTIQKLKAGRKLQSVLKSVFAITEKYPSLKSNEDFLNIQQKLAEIENKLESARKKYNNAIMAYNVSTTKIPGKWFASLYRFGKKQYLKIPAEQKVAPPIGFNNKQKI